MKQTTKKCPKCGNTQLVHLSSLKQKICTDCQTVIKWVKDKGQGDWI